MYLDIANTIHGARDKSHQVLLKVLHYLHKPVSPYSLAIFRIIFGVMMIQDLFEERGLSSAEKRWGDNDECRFPLLPSLKPLQLEWMCLLYIVMLTGLIGVILGAFFQLSCLLYALPYWYLVFLEKSYWNNHTYLYGLVALQLLFTHANHCWSVDGIRDSRRRFTHIPRWNYFLPRGQIFLLYFIAGIKKLEDDWIQGYSMHHLGSHWIFGPFRLFLNANLIDLVVVHWGGFLLDLTVGFFLLHGKSRPYALFFSTAFHIMNSQIFSIGMFAYLMLATGPLFCSYDWPHKFITNTCFLRETWKRGLLYENQPNNNESCIYQETFEPVKSESAEIQKAIPTANGDHKDNCSRKSTVGVKHVLTTVVFCLYFAVQFWLPFSHSWTPGFSTWTKGQYGYSWDMMVHSWNRVHTRLTVVDTKTGQTFFLNPEAWSSSRRWSQHANMVKQFGDCVAERLGKDYNMTQIALYVDVWMSVNGRVVQRMFDPTIDVLKAPWSPFQPVDWVLPILTDMTGWRDTLRKVTEKTKEKNFTDVLFMADFPGYSLVNYIDPELSDVELNVLQGKVEIYVPQMSNVTLLKQGEAVNVTTGMFHKVTPMGHKPACYYYRYINATMRDLEQAPETFPGGMVSSGVNKKRLEKFTTLRGNQKAMKKVTLPGLYKTFAQRRIGIWRNSTVMIYKTLRWLVFGTPMRNTTEKTKTPYENFFFLEFEADPWALSNENIFAMPIL